MMNFGSGSALLGGDAGQALNEAIARRSQGQAGGTAQVSPAAPTAGNQVPVPSPLPSPAGGMSPTPASNTPSLGGGGVGMTPSPESELIIKALASRLSTIGKLQGA